eukprot:4499499-Amphidinium_carterae.1
MERNKNGEQTALNEGSFPLHASLSAFSFPTTGSGSWQDMLDWLAKSEALQMALAQPSQARWARKLRPPFAYRP